MSSPRFYCPIGLEPGHRITLPDHVARHAVGVLRLRSGDALTLFNGNGSEFRGTLEKAGKHAEALLRDRQTPQRESPLDITLIQGISSGERMDYTLQKAVELGITAIQPVVMRRTIVRMDANKQLRKREHWQGVVVSACEQCGRNIVPTVAAIEDFQDWLRRLSQVSEPSESPITHYLLDPEASTRLRDLPPPAGPITLIAGPEGGLDPAERLLARALAAKPVSLGPRILRTETAALAALSAMQTLWGDI